MIINLWLSDILISLPRALRRCTDTDVFDVGAEIPSLHRRHRPGLDQQSDVDPVVLRGPRE